MEPQNKEPESQLCKYTGQYGGWSNTAVLELLYSIKNKKFIKGYIDGSRAGGYVIYRLYPGRYLRFEVKYWNKEDPPYTLIIYDLIVHGPREDGYCRTESVSRFIIRFYKKSELESMNLPPQIHFFVSYLPRYHEKLSSSIFDCTFTEEENLTLLALRGNINVGEEHE